MKLQVMVDVQVRDARTCSIQCKWLENDAIANNQHTAFCVLFGRPVKGFTFHLRRCRPCLTKAKGIA